MSTFVSQLTHDLSVRITPPVNTPPGTPGKPESPTKETLRALFLSLNQNASLSESQRCLETLRNVTPDGTSLSGTDEEEAALQKSVVSRIAVDVYGKALDTFLSEARQMEDELEWWTDIERSTGNTALYLIQSACFH